MVISWPSAGSDIDYLLSRGLRVSFVRVSEKTVWAELWDGPAPEAGYRGYGGDASEAISMAREALEWTEEERRKLS